MLATAPQPLTTRFCSQPAYRKGTSMCANAAAVQNCSTVLATAVAETAKLCKLEQQTSNNIELQHSCHLYLMIHTGIAVKHNNTPAVCTLPSTLGQSKALSHKRSPNYAAAVGVWAQTLIEHHQKLCATPSATATVPSTPPSLLPHSSVYH